MRLLAQVFGLELILPAILDEARSALTELEIDLFSDALREPFNALGQKKKGAI